MHSYNVMIYNVNNLMVKMFGKFIDEIKTVHNIIDKLLKAQIINQEILLFTGKCIFFLSKFGFYNNLIVGNVPVLYFKVIYSFRFLVKQIFCVGHSYLAKTNIIVISIKVTFLYYKHF